MANDNIKWMKFKARELEITRKTAPPKEEWTEAIGGMDQQMQSVAFWRGDLFNAGTKWYGETFATSILDPLESNVSTWQNNSLVCRKIEAPRRRDELSYSHHDEVDQLEPDDQDFYLQLAIDEGLSVRDLRKRIKEDRGEGSTEKPLAEFLKSKADEIETRIWEAEGDVQGLMRTAVESLLDAFEIERDNAKVDKAA